MVLLDPAARIQMFNRAMEQVLGWRRFELERQPWVFCTPEEFRNETRRWLADALRGALRSFEGRALTRSGIQIVFAFELALVGRPDEQGLLMTAHQWRTESRDASGHARELDYDVAVEPPTFGALVRLVIDSERVQLNEDARCYQMLHGREKPCEPCPLQVADQPWPRISVRPLDGEGFEVKSAERLEGGLVRVRCRTLPTDVLEALHSAKLQHMADRANLSAREREVLMHLMLGRTIEDIASMIGIAVRTVKFHQANVLEKLGADSRADLMRLLF